MHLVLMQWHNQLTKKVQSHICKEILHALSDGILRHKNCVWRCQKLPDTISITVLYWLHYETSPTHLTKICLSTYANLRTRYNRRHSLSVLCTIEVLIMQVSSNKCSSPAMGVVVAKLQFVFLGAVITVR